MNLHVVLDNPRYVDPFIARCEKLDLQNEIFITLKFSKNRQIENLCSPKIRKINSVKEALSMIESKEINKIYFHYLDNSAIKLLRVLPSDKLIYWILWGNDLYKYPDLKKNIYLPRTKKLLDHLNPRGYKIILDIIRNHIIRKRLKNAFSKIDFVCVQVKGDFDIVKNLSNKFKMEHKYFAYIGANVDNRIVDKEKISQNNLKILIGNSASPANNHLDAFYKLLPFLSKIDKIICPLSYSGSSDYVDEIIRTGNELFGAKFRPLTTYLPSEEYQKILDNVDIGIFYHVRQQAYSNTIMMLEQGKKILMNSKSTLYKTYIDFGIPNVFSDLEKLLNSAPINNDNLYNELGEQKIDEWYTKLFR